MSLLTVLPGFIEIHLNLFPLVPTVGCLSFTGSNDVNAEFDAGRLLSHWFLKVDIFSAFRITDFLLLVLTAALLTKYILLHAARFRVGTSRQYFDPLAPISVEILPYKERSAFICHSGKCLCSLSFVYIRVIPCRLGQNQELFQFHVIDFLEKNHVQHSLNELDVLCMCILNLTIIICFSLDLVQMCPEHPRDIKEPWQHSSIYNSC